MSLGLGYNSAIFGNQQLLQFLAERYLLGRNVVPIPNFDIKMRQVMPLVGQHIGIRILQLQNVLSVPKAVVEPDETHAVH